MKDRPDYLGIESSVRCYRCTAASKTIVPQRRRSRPQPPKTRRGDSASGLLERHSASLPPRKLCLVCVLLPSRSPLSVQPHRRESQERPPPQTQRRTSVLEPRSPWLTLFRRVPAEVRRPPTN